MSIAVFKMVLDSSLYKGNTRLTLLALANHADDNGVCWPGIELLAQETRQSVRNVFRNLHVLITDGVVTCNSRPARGKKVVFSINLERLQFNPLPPCDRKSKSVYSSQYTPEQSALRPCYYAMVRRCHKPSDKSYKYYGDRGIKVCDEWRVGGFIAFAQWITSNLGPKPGPRYSLDRINNEGDYEPGNLRWATPSQQLANRRRNKKLEDFTDRDILVEMQRRGLQTTGDQQRFTYDQHNNTDDQNSVTGDHYDGVIMKEPSRTVIKATVSKTLRSRKARSAETPDSKPKPDKPVPAEPADPRFQPCMEVLKRYWDYMNRDTGLAFSPTPADCKALKDFLRDNRKVDVEAFMRSLGFRAKSEDVIPSDPIRLWIKNVLRYASGPVTQYNRLASHAQEISKADKRSLRIRERAARVAGAGGCLAGDFAGSLSAGDFGGRADALAGGSAPLQLRGDQDGGSGPAAQSAIAATGERHDAAVAGVTAGERSGTAHRDDARGAAAGVGTGAPARAAPPDG